MTTKIKRSGRSLYSLFKKLFNELALCWHDPNASPEIAAKYRSRQYYVVIQQMPLSSVVNQSASLLIAVLFWNQANHILLAYWAAMLWVIGFANLYLWWLYQTTFKDKLISKRATWLLTTDLGVIAFLYVSMSVYLFGVVDEEGRLIITAILAACLATGTWEFSRLPQAGLVWVSIIALGIVLGLGFSPVKMPLLFTTMMVGYWAILVSIILVTSRTFIFNLKSRTEIEQQREVLDLLLTDFEQSASDWLWETDKSGKLQHASVRLAEMIGISTEALQQRLFLDVLTGLLTNPTADERGMLDYLRQLFSWGKPFRDVVIPVIVNGQKSWWAITAKPLLNDYGSVNGWRGVGSDVTSDRQRELDMARLANFDALTGLANRNQFWQRLNAFYDDELSETNSCTLLMVDLDNFKTVNDSLGHAAGDELLQEVARRLASVVEEGQLLARLGGDEFAVFCPNHLGSTEVEIFSEKLRCELSQPWSDSGYRIDIRMSVGVAFGPDDADTANGLMKASDMALYAAKAAGKNTLRLFEMEMDTQAQHKMALLSNLKKGLQRGEFRVFYQPQVNFKTGKVSGFEALVRWQHPEEGLVLPNEFIPLAEESGLIIELGAWVLEQACKDATTWPSDIRLSVNVSAVQFTSDDISKSVENALQQSGLDRRQLELELTETTLMKESETVMAILRDLRATGIRIALDDFGTGYSSLSYLQQLPIDKLKIDRAFICNLDHGDQESSAYSILDTITRLAHAFNLETTGEGIETRHECNVLRQMSCTYGQGYLFARPFDSSEAKAYIARANPIFGYRQVEPEEP